ncbi:hypothetical protein COU57_00045 [Candidatus Pacearchaeota archaeon CG10_big_fil_rev_8_21_14_0_10_32_14]|nr:MAG: hypothetical protein COU57_00045 [Candidatus Pacearchaeota archaeon CG10_big_fil_rev_8_21_14_0_10_32_14]
MPLSMTFYESDEKFSDDLLEKLDNYGDNMDDLGEVSIFRKKIIVGKDTYKIFKMGKKVKEVVPGYSANEQGNIISEDQEITKWADNYAYIKVNSKELYVSGPMSGWVSNFISILLFGSESKIKRVEIDTKKLEDDIRKSKKFTPIGTSFIDPDQTKVTIKNSGGIDLDTNRHTKDCEDIEKNHIDIIIQTDDELNFNVYVYPHGKVTFQGFIKDNETALRIFLKIWNEIREYS